MSTQQSSNVRLGISRKSLEGTVIRACRVCQAPGTYSNSNVIKVGWPECYNPDRAGQSVGSVCPRCGERRPDVESLGELSATMPMFIWKCVLAVKWLLVTFKTITQPREFSR